MRYDYLYGTNYTIEQPAHMYHFNSDTEYLGRMMEVQPEETVLDIPVPYYVTLPIIKRFLTE